MGDWKVFPSGSVVKNAPDNAGDIGLISGLGRSPGGGIGNPLQYSCLENPMDRGAWWGTVMGLQKSRTQLSEWTPPPPTDMQDIPITTAMRTISLLLCLLFRAKREKHTSSSAVVPNLLDLMPDDLSWNRNKVHNKCNALELILKPSPFSVCRNIVFHEIDLWYQNGYGPLFQCIKMKYKHTGLGVRETEFACSFSINVKCGLEQGRQRSLVGYSPWGPRVRHDLVTKQQLKQNTCDTLPLQASDFT